VEWRARLGMGLLYVLIGAALTGCCLCLYAIDRDETLDARRKAQEEFEAAPVPEVVLGTPPASPPTLALPAYPAGTLATGESWPRACDLLTDDTIRAMLPQADLFHRTGTAETRVFRTEQLLPDSGLKVQVASQTIHVPEHQCDVRFWLPHKTMNDVRHPLASLSVAVDIAGDPAANRSFAWSLYLDPEPADLAFARARGAYGCRTFGESRRTCTKGALTITVDGYLNAPIDPVEVLRMPEAAARGETNQKRYEATVLPTLMTHLLARIP
jgi:hypothetical protein